ncbi:hypothetical protein [Marinicella sp. W31]|uniref:hypothetical protein n=1 Tax=Marinicella sp. W31 TaxID=3023713 RepID=UPI003756C074
MKLFTYKSKAKCTVEHLFHCMTDIAYLKGEIKRSNASTDTLAKLQYDGSSPFAAGKKLVIKGTSVRMTVLIEENQPPNYLQAMVSSDTGLEKTIGHIAVKVKLYQQGVYAHYHVLFECSKEARGLKKVFIKMMAFIFKFSNRASNRRFVRYVESTVSNN